MSESSKSRKRGAGRLSGPEAASRWGWVHLAGVVTLVFLMVACRDEQRVEPTSQTTQSARTGSEAEAAAVVSQSAKPERSVPDPEARESMVGWWLRHDQSYMIVIESVDESGRVDARYLNPRSVNVSNAEAWIEEGILRLLVELTDENYPGNFYELVYRAGDDVWVGVYHHLGNDESYEVYFLRFEGDSGEGES